MSNFMMVIDKVHGLQATSLTLNDRFTMLLSAEPNNVAMWPKRRMSMNSYLNTNLNYLNRNLLEQIARRLEQQAKRIVYQQTMRQRLGNVGGLRRFGSESNLPALRRSNSFGNLGQGSINNRVTWRQSNGNLSHASTNNILNRIGRGRPLQALRRRGGGQRVRGRLRDGRQGVGVMQPPTTNRPQVARRGSAPRARGRGGILRNQPTKSVPSKEELDTQLEQYMAGSKAALDRELDQYMKDAMELGLE